MTYLTCGDSIYPQIPPTGLNVYAGYVDGHWPDYYAMKALHPGVKYMAIDTTGRIEPADVLDIETGDAGPGDFNTFMANWHPLNTVLPVAYSSASAIAAVIQATPRPRDNYLLWVAHYTNVAHICTSADCYPASPIPWVADGTQWTTHNNSWDESLLSSAFFSAPPTPPSPTDPPAPEEVHMFVLQAGSPAAVYLVRESDAVHISNSADVPSLMDLCGQSAPIPVVSTGFIAAANGGTMPS